MKKLLVVAAMAGGLMFAGLSDSADADHRGRGRGHNHGHFHGRHDHGWNRGFNNQRYNYRYRYNDGFYRGGRSFNFGLNFGGYPGYGNYGPSYGYYDYCW